MTLFERPWTLETVLTTLPLDRLEGAVGLPLLMALLGTLIGHLRPLGVRGHSHLQHLTAGILFSVVAVEILPEVIHRQTPLQLSLGFAAGVSVMLLLARLSHPPSLRDGRGVWPLTLMMGTAIDLLLDGLILSFTYETVVTAGRTLSLALAVELLTVSLTLAATLKRRRIGFLPSLLAAALIQGCLALGAFGGVWMLPRLPDPSRDLILSFGLAALLFLVTEELLVEPHRETDAPLSTVFFFAGFLVFLLIGQQHAT